MSHGAVRGEGLCFAYLPPARSIGLLVAETVAKI
jgi:hypothetical protein